MHQTQRSHAIKGLPALAISLALLGVLGGCATGPGRSADDPLEGVNRATYQFNDVLDRAVAKPVAKGYNAVTPGPIKTMVNNFFSNIGDATVMANDLLQGKITDGTEDFMRIVMNSFFGIGGLVDFATPAGLPKHDQDFGLTLGHWGVPAGPYVVLPLFGPSTIRDAAGFAVDLEASPTSYLRPAIRNILYPLNFVSTRARYLGATDLLSAAALDKYSFTRDAYLGRRKYQLNGGKDDTLPDYGNDPAAPAAKPGDGAATAPATNPAAGAADATAHPLTEQKVGAVPAAPASAAEGNPGSTSSAAPDAPASGAATGQ
jgi:phospholipid-binding lipoprotein MlaA